MLNLLLSSEWDGENMSVWLVAIEKERSLPWASFYLGEFMTRRVVFGAGSPLLRHGPVQTYHRMDHYPVTSPQAAVLLALLEEKDALYEDHELEGAREFLEGLGAFSMRDDYVLYVEVA